VGPQGVFGANGVAQGAVEAQTKVTGAPGAAKGVVGAEEATKGVVVPTGPPEAGVVTADPEDVEFRRLQEAEKASAVNIRDGRYASGYPLAISAKSDIRIRWPWRVSAPKMTSRLQNESFLGKFQMQKAA
jgi:hypothetical protein